MKRLSLLTLFVLLVSLTAVALPASALPAAANGSAPSSYITPPLPNQFRQPSFNVGYDALNAGSDPLAYVELWYRYSLDNCDYTEWTFWARDWTCAGGYHCGATFAFTASAQGTYEFYTKAYSQGGYDEDKTSWDDWTWVDYSNPIIGWPPNPADGAVVSGVINVGTYFNDSYLLTAVSIWDDTWHSFYAFAGWLPYCYGPPAPALGPEGAAPRLKAGKALAPPTQARKGAPSRLEGDRQALNGPSTLSTIGLPAGTYWLPWDTTTVPDGPVEICFYAEDWGYPNNPADQGWWYYGNYTLKCITVIVNNGTAKVPQLLSATASGGAAASEMQVSFVGLAPPPEEENNEVTSSKLPTTLWVEVKVEGIGGFAAESEGVPIGPDRRWTYSLTLPDDAWYQASFRTRTDYGAVSPWITLDFNPAGLPANLTMLTQGYDGYVGAAETYLNLWDPAKNSGWEKLLKVRSYDVKKGLARFDLAPLAGVSGDQVARAGLVLWTEAQTNPQPLDLHVYPVTAAWDAFSATWLEAAAGMPWTLPGAGAVPDDYLLEPTVAATLRSGDWAVLDVTDFVKGWLDGTLPDQGFLLTGTSQGAVRFTLGMSAHTQTGYRPTLFVEWSP